MEQPKIRTLRADEIDVRVGQVKTGKGISFLLYKDARCDMAILDETFGALNWKREHSRDNQNCTVSVYDPDKQQWVGKEDTGTESNTEKEKGLASDSFKRACVNWGIGRELYTAPFIWIATPYTDDLKNEKLHVAKIDYNERREISQLVIADRRGNILYTFGQTGFTLVLYAGKTGRVAAPSQPTIPAVTKQDKAKAVNAFLKDNAAALSHYITKFSVADMYSLTAEHINAIYDELKKNNRI